MTTRRKRKTPERASPEAVENPPRKVPYPSVQPKTKEERPKTEEPKAAQADPMSRLLSMVERIDQRLTALEARPAEVPQGNTQVVEVSKIRYPEVAPVPEDGIAVFASPYWNFKIKLADSRYVPVGPSGEYRIIPPVMAEFSNGFLSVSEKEMVEVAAGVEKPKVELLRKYLQECVATTRRPDFVEVKPGETVKFPTRKERKPLPMEVSDHWEPPTIQPDIPEPPPEARETLDRQQKARTRERNLV